MNPKKTLIVVVSILVPIVVAFLFVHTDQQADVGGWVYRLPHLNALINGITGVILILGVVAIKSGNEKWHKIAMSTAFVLGFIFLISYITYHASVPSTKFGDINHDGQVVASELEAVGSLRTWYIVLLLSHILMAIAALPFVLMAVYTAWSDNRQKHKKIVRFAFPIWLLVSITGVMVYLMISPYY